MVLRGRAVSVQEVEQMLYSMGFDSIDPTYVQGVIANFGGNNPDGLNIGEFEKVFAFLSERNTMVNTSSPRPAAAAPTAVPVPAASPRQPSVMQTRFNKFDAVRIWTV